MPRTAPQIEPLGTCCGAYRAAALDALTHVETAAAPDAPPDGTAGGV